MAEVVPLPVRPRPRPVPPPEPRPAAVDDDPYRFGYVAGLLVAVCLVPWLLMLSLLPRRRG